MHGAPQRGEPVPLGATATARATNFALFSSSARAVSLLLFTADDRASGRITVEIELDPASNKSGDVWHVSVPNLHPDLLYAYRVSGPSAPPAGPGRAGQAQRFVSDFILLDPYAKVG
jgi:pullulanase/glycogen debranching enzyme